MVVPSSSWSARRGSGEGAGELEEGQENRTFAHVLHAPASRSFSRAIQSSLGENRRNGHFHGPHGRDAVDGETPIRDNERVGERGRESRSAVVASCGSSYRWNRSSVNTKCRTIYRYVTLDPVDDTCSASSRLPAPSSVSASLCRLLWRAGVPSSGVAWGDVGGAARCG